MRKTISILSILILFYSCKKEQNASEDPYALPWSTKNITYDQISRMCGSHSSGYNIFYKDSLIRFKCTTYGGAIITDSLRIDDSQLLFYTAFPADYRSEVVYTNDGGLNWQESAIGMQYLLKFHFVQKELIYCFTSHPGVKNLTVSGIGKSNLKTYQDSTTKGRHYITDLGASSLNLDSTVVPLNDSVTFVIKFK